MTPPPLPEPFDYCYEWETGYGIVRKFSATPHHGIPPTRTVALYTADQMRAALAAVPAQPVSDELIESLWFDAQRAWGEQTSVHPGEHVLFARLLERRIAAAPQAVPVPAGRVLVPVEPTEAMRDAANTLPEVFSVGDEYRAMLAAAPK